MSIDYRQEGPFESRRYGVETEVMGGPTEQLETYAEIDEKYAPKEKFPEVPLNEANLPDNVVRLPLRGAGITVAA
jgi:hypothetical protein